MAKQLHIHIHRPTKTRDAEGEGKWITLSPSGTHVKVDGQGTITTGPSGMSGKKPSELSKKGTGKSGSTPSSLSGQEWKSHKAAGVSHEKAAASKGKSHPDYTNHIQAGKARHEMATSMLKAQSAEPGLKSAHERSAKMSQQRAEKFESRIALHAQALEAHAKYEAAREAGNKEQASKHFAEYDKLRLAAAGKVDTEAGLRAGFQQAAMHWSKQAASEKGGKPGQFKEPQRQMTFRQILDDPQGRKDINAYEDVVSSLRRYDGKEPTLQNMLAGMQADIREKYGHEMENPYPVTSTDPKEGEVGHEELTKYGKYFKKGEKVKTGSGKEFSVISHKGPSVETAGGNFHPTKIDRVATPSAGHAAGKEAMAITTHLSDPAWRGGSTTHHEAEQAHLKAARLLRSEGKPEMAQFHEHSAAEHQYHHREEEKRSKHTDVPLDTKRIDWKQR